MSKRDMERVRGRQERATERGRRRMSVREEGRGKQRGRGEGNEMALYRKRIQSSFRFDESVICVCDARLKKKQATK